MNPVSIPYHLFGPAVLCLGFLLWIVWQKKYAHGGLKQRAAWITASFLIVLYTVIVGSAGFADVRAQVDLNRYDLNQDGFFGEAEQTPAQKEAMQKLISGTGRDFSVFIGIFFCLILALPIYVFAWLILKERARRAVA